MVELSLKSAALVAKNYGYFMCDWPKWDLNIHLAFLTKLRRLIHWKMEYSGEERKIFPCAHRQKSLFSKFEIILNVIGLKKSSAKIKTSSN